MSDLCCFLELPWLQVSQIFAISDLLLLLRRQEPGETALHLAVRMGDRNSLHIVDFLAQNR